MWILASDLGLTGTEAPAAIDADRALSERLEGLRVAAAQLMGIPGSAAVPKVGVVAPPAAFGALDGVAYAAGASDLLARVISMGNCHRAVPLTAAMCLAVAARVPGTVAAECVASHEGDGARSPVRRLPAPRPSHPPRRAWPGRTVTARARRS